MGKMLHPAAAQVCHPPGWKISTTFLGSILYPQAAVVLLVLIWSHRLPRDDGLQFCLKENLHPALTPTQCEGAQLKHRLCSNVLFVVVHLLKGLFEVALSVLLASVPSGAPWGVVFSPQSR